MSNGLFGALRAFWDQGVPSCSWELGAGSWSRKLEPGAGSWELGALVHVRTCALRRSCALL